MPDERYLVIAKPNLQTRVTDLQNGINVLLDTKAVAVKRGGREPYFILEFDAGETVAVISDRGNTEYAAVLLQEPVFLAFAFSEVWQVLEYTKQKATYRFEHLRLRFYAANDNKGAVRQLLRMEWESEKCRDKEEGIWSFDGDWAAHPHLQVDRTGVDPFQSLITAPFERVDEATETPAEMPAGEPIKGWFSKLHLPLHAPWHKLPYKGFDRPYCHQLKPNAPSDLTNWLCWAAGYIRREIKEHGYKITEPTR
ncbi:MAG: hypothetical protein KGL39_53075 [Patescibacteria group bacterium]|nr:hypothetical protein [Patescibacteria group bacterium]